MPASSFLILGLVLLSAFVLSSGLLVLLRPWSVRHTMASPNARSSHVVPTPQGGGIAVVSAALAASAGALAFLPGMAQVPLALATLALATVLLAAVGALDDMRSLGPMP